MRRSLLASLLPSVQGLVPGRERGEYPAVQSVHRAICHRGGRDGDGDEQVQAAERDCVGMHYDRDGASGHASRGQHDVGSGSRLLLGSGLAWWYVLC